MGIELRIEGCMGISGFPNIGKNIFGYWTGYLGYWMFGILLSDIGYWIWDIRDFIFVY